MRQNQSRYENHVIYFIPGDDILLTNPIQEEFRDITDAIVPGVQPYYMISNYGRLYHKYKQEFLRNNIDSKGYLYKPLALRNGKPKNCRIHRLVMLAFNYICGCENLLVNHIDENKCNPCIWNLEWVTFSENGSYSANIHKDRYDHGNRLDENLVHIICKMLENPNITIAEISSKFNIPYGTIQGIQNKRSWTNISDQYNIQRRKINNNLSIDQVHLLCKYFQDVEKPDHITVEQHCRDGLICIGIENPTTLQVRSAKKIRRKETYSYISKDYNF